MISNFQSRVIELSELHIDWNNIYNLFVEKFNTAFQNANKKLHFDFIRSKKDLTYTHVDGAKFNWIDPILLDTLLCVYNNITPTDHRSKRRTFDQQKILLDCVVESLDMESSNDGWNSTFMLKTGSNVYDTASIDSISLRKKKTEDNEIVSTKKISTRGNKTVISDLRRDEQNISLKLNNLPENWSRTELFVKEIDKTTKSKKKRNEICDVLLREIDIRKEKLSNVVVNAICKIISSVNEEYYNNKIIIKTYKSRKTSNTTDMIPNKRSSKRKISEIHTADAEPSKRKRKRKGKNIPDEDDLLDPFGFGFDEYFTYENSSDSPDLSFDVIASFESA